MARSKGAKTGATLHAPAGMGDVFQAGRWKWWHGMAAGMLLMISPGAALLAITLAGPLLFAMTADKTPYRAVTRTVSLFSLAGAIEPVRAFLTTGHDLDAAMAILGNVTTILLAWMCGGAGWLLSELFSLGATFFSMLRHTAKQKAGESAMIKIQQEWGIEAMPPS